MLVQDLRERMTAPEWIGWSIYYQRIAQRQELESKRAR